jgi:nucleoside phosphorylase
MGSVDVLLVTALPEEFNAAKEVATADAPGMVGVQQWREQASDARAPFVTGDYVAGSGRRLSIALVRPPRMGGRGTAPVVTTLTNQLRPACLAMCGVCAGNPDETAPGDVVVPETVYEWDEGKLTDNGFEGDHRQYPQDARWLRVAQELMPDGLPSHGPASADEAAVWFLERLHLGQDPRRHPARPRYFPPGTWHERLEQLASDGLIRFAPEGDLSWALTPDGTARIQRILASDVDGPRTLPFAIVTGPMASGSAVVTESGIWERLKAMGVRRIAALEMEAATIVTIAHERQVPHWLIAKGVMDRADKHKDDRFRAFAARASAEVLFRLLTDLLPEASGGAAVNGVALGRVKLQVIRQLQFDWMDLADVLGVPTFVRARFPHGEGPRGVWEWLESRGRLGDLPAALEEVGRRDLADLMRTHVA